MPYIEQKRRIDLAMEYADTKHPGELNYLITMACKMYLTGEKESYQKYNDVIGALESAKLEIYRRKVAIYENKKLKDNGDVF